MTYDPNHPAQWAILVEEGRFAINPRSPANGTTHDIALAGLDYRSIAETVAKEGACPAIINRATGERVDLALN